jgi:hypothetical protein
VPTARRDGKTVETISGAGFQGGLRFSAEGFSWAYLGDSKTSSNKIYPDDPMRSSLRTAERQAQKQGRVETREDRGTRAGRRQKGFLKSGDGEGFAGEGSAQRGTTFCFSNLGALIRVSRKVLRVRREGRAVMGLGWRVICAEARSGTQAHFPGVCAAAARERERERQRERARDERWGREAREEMRLTRRQVRRRREQLGTSEERQRPKAMRTPRWETNAGRRRGRRRRRECRRGEERN